MILLVESEAVFTKADMWVLIYRKEWVRCEKLRLRVSDFVTEFELGRQAAWRPRCNRGGVDKTVVGIVHSAVVLRLRVSGFVTEFELGRQAAWRPRNNHDSVVKTLVTLCSLLISRWLACLGKENSPVCCNPQSQSRKSWELFYLCIVCMRSLSR